MAETFTKILNLRENEKQIAHKAFLKSQDVFEEVATKLYQLLRKKENAEAAYDKYIQSPSELHKIKEQIIYIEKLNGEIIRLEKEVQLARNQMNQKQNMLNEAYIEVKKFESIVERRRKEIAEKTARMENAFMDEISINQYLSSKNR